MLSLCACMQGTESWERRLVEARHEHGLLEWELDKADGAPDPTQQLLRSPLPGIAALLCTEEEICARQQQLAKAGALKRMRVPETQLEANLAIAEQQQLPTNRDVRMMQKMPAQALNSPRLHPWTGKAVCDQQAAAAATWSQSWWGCPPNQ